MINATMSLSKDFVRKDDEEAVFILEWVGGEKDRIFACGFKVESGMVWFYTTRRAETRAGAKNEHAQVVVATYAQCHVVRIYREVAAAKTMKEQL